MKPTTILSLLLAAALIYLFIQHRVSHETQQELKAERDSLLNESKHLQYLQDSANARIDYLEQQNSDQDLIIQSRELEVISTRETANKYRKQYEKLNRLHFTNNAQRDSLLIVLYPK